LEAKGTGGRVKVIIKTTTEHKHVNAAIATQFKFCLDSKLKTKLTEIKVTKLPALKKISII
jgi:hypothetical protein